MFGHDFFWGVPDISTTPRIISPSGKSHIMAFNLALSWKRSFLHVSLYFFHFLFSKKHLVVIAFFMFCCFCAGWMVVVTKFLLDGSGHLTYPESFFLLGDIPHSGIKKGGTGKKCLIWLPLFFSHFSVFLLFIPHLFSIS